MELVFGGSCGLKNSWSSCSRMPPYPNSSPCKKPPTPVMKFTAPPTGLSYHTQNGGFALANDCSQFFSASVGFPSSSQAITCIAQVMAGPFALFHSAIEHKKDVAQVSARFVIGQVSPA